MANFFEIMSSWVVAPFTFLSSWVQVPFVALSSLL